MAARKTMVTTPSGPFSGLAGVVVSAQQGRVTTNGVPVVVELDPSMIEPGHAGASYKRRPS
jgi:hypothetical protein